MTFWAVEVYVGSLVSRDATFPRVGANDPEFYPGEMYMPGEHIESILLARRNTPEDVRVLTPRVMLGGTDNDGTTYRERQEREVVMSRKLKFVVESCDKLPNKMWHPWVLKKISRTEA